jgi:hypothetical protein
VDGRRRVPGGAVGRTGETRRRALPIIVQSGPGGAVPGLYGPDTAVSHGWTGLELAESSWSPWLQSARTAAVNSRTFLMTATGLNRWPGGRTQRVRVPARHSSHSLSPTHNPS